MRLSILASCSLVLGSALAAADPTAFGPMEFDIPKHSSMGKRPYYDEKASNTKLTGTVFDDPRDIHMLSHGDKGKMKESEGLQSHWKRSQKEPGSCVSPIFSPLP